MNCPSDKQIRDDSLRNSSPDLSSLTKKSMIAGLAGWILLVGGCTMGVEYLYREHKKDDTTYSTSQPIDYNLPERK